MVSVPSPAPRLVLPRPRAIAPLLDAARRRARAAYTGLVPPRPPDPYRPLRHFLVARPRAETTVTFHALEALLGAPLPDEAWRREWWANDRALPQARAWLD